ncbi:hypothetical protein CEXT_156381 [Caerostris extrusa]|uniref:Uncharacterized protein n=1 Tax=Caerostris extrusa TaxID=172846 RepID=A0AAV4SEW8_CAEEX|nr:hypothetical protein CEXT_156381 [Caerostris extrusa]
MKESFCTWKSFVSSRIAEIQNLKNSKDCRHCIESETILLIILASTEIFDNKSQKDALWWFGPPWLVKDYEVWPKNRIAYVTVQALGKIWFKHFTGVTMIKNQSLGCSLQIKTNLLDVLCRLKPISWTFSTGSTIPVLPQVIEIVHKRVLKPIFLMGVLHIYSAAM